MAHNQALITELKNEAASTRKMLERIPDETLGWTPHAKSMDMAHLASHVAELPGYVTTSNEYGRTGFRDV